MSKAGFAKKQIITFSALIFFIALAASSFAAESLKLPSPAATISMDFKDANLKDVLKVFSMQSGINFVASQAVQDRKVTLYLDKVPVLDCMEKLFKANNLSYEKDPASNIIIINDWGEPQVQTITKSYVLKYNRLRNSRIEKEISNYLEETAEFAGATVGTGGSTSGGTTATATTSEEGITESIKTILTKYGKVTEDIRSNSLVVTDIPSNFPVIDQTIAALDVAVPQVLLEVEMLDVSKNDVKKLGINWPATLAYLTVPGSRMTDFPFGNKGMSGSNWQFKDGTTWPGPGDMEWVYPAWPGNKFPPSVLTIIGSSLSFDFQKTLTDSKYLARPRILTLSNETAEIKIATEESVGTITTVFAGEQTSQTEAERFTTGVILRVTPQVNTDTGEITMFVMPSVAEAVQGNTIVAGGNIGNVTYRDPEVRSTKSVVRVKDGQTIVIGGLIRNKKQKVVTKLPFFGDIPLVGNLFRHTDTTPDVERELIVFITPHIVKEGESQTYSQGIASKEFAAEMKK
ncbi:MAG: hypothetical protein NC914_00530 [Candidatus Omnitrophica bacterium]|nr:hypothetical protein [Candidatus Omnitrophota bacterium]